LTSRTLQRHLDYPAKRRILLSHSILSSRMQLSQNSQACLDFTRSAGDISVQSTKSLVTRSLSTYQDGRVSTDSRFWNNPRDSSVMTPTSRNQTLMRIIVSKHWAKGSRRKDLTNLKAPLVGCEVYWVGNTSSILLLRNMCGSTPTVRHLHLSLVPSSKWRRFIDNK
jgi:hypothetical protein